MTTEQFEQEIKKLREEMDWVKAELSRIKRDRPRPEDQNPYDLNRHQLKPIKRVRR